MGFLTWPLVTLVAIICVCPVHPVVLAYGHSTQLGPRRSGQPHNRLSHHGRHRARLLRAGLEAPTGLQRVHDGLVHGCFRRDYRRNAYGERRAEHRVHLGVLCRRPPAGCRQTRKSRGHVPAGYRRVVPPLLPERLGERPCRAVRSLCHAGPHGGDQKQAPLDQLAALRRDGAVRGSRTVRVYQWAGDYRRAPRLPSHRILPSSRGA